MIAHHAAAAAPWNGRKSHTNKLVNSTAKTADKWCSCRIGLHLLYYLNTHHGVLEL